MPRVSLVLPNYNYARYLDERIRSLLYQSYTDFELVIIDDASTDDSLSVIDRFDDPRIRLIVREKNSGRVYGSWNEALKSVSGELVLFAGADDVAERTMVEELVACFDRDPQLGFAHCGFLMIDANGAILQTEIPLGPFAASIVESLRSNYVAPAPAEWCRLLVTNFIWNASGVLLRTELVRAHAGFDAEMLIAADWLLYLQIAREHGVAYIREPLNSFRQLEKSVSKKLQGALLIEEMYECLLRQRPHIETQEARNALRTGITQISNAANHYISANTQVGNAAEVERLRFLEEHYAAAFSGIEGA